jgi:HAD superfamily hydrolase (TIGR01509 family)
VSAAKAKLPPAAILDIDGTLIDTNYQHALAWYRAFRQHGRVLPIWRLHRHIGMGGDQFVSALAGERFEEEHGDSVRDAEKVLYRALIDETEPFQDAQRLIQTLSDRGHTIVLASSANAQDVEHYVDQLEARKLVAGWTTSDDVEQTKPEPDLVLAALEKAGTKKAVMIGDSTWDCEAAKRAGLKTIGVLTGGFSEEELEEAGAAVVFRSLGELIDGIEDSPLA